VGGMGVGTGTGTVAGAGEPETSPRVTRRTRHGYDRSMRRDRSLNTVNRCSIALLDRIAASSVHAHITQPTHLHLSYITQPSPTNTSLGTVPITIVLSLCSVYPPGMES
jgi:hypothetical protein